MKCSTAALCLPILAVLALSSCRSVTAPASIEAPRAAELEKHRHVLPDAFPPPSTFATPDHGAGEIAASRELLYVVGGDRVQAFDHRGRHAFDFGTNLVSPWKIQADDRRVYVGDANGLHVFDRRGRFLFDISLGFELGWFALDAKHGDLYVANGLATGPSEVTVYHNDKAKQSFAVEPGLDLTARDGAIYSRNLLALVQYDKRGREVRRMTSLLTQDETFYPASDGSFFTGVTDRRSGTISHWSASGEFLDQWPMRAVGFAESPDGGLYVSTDGRVVKFGGVAPALAAR